jgi:hypothetical protein
MWREQENEDCFRETSSKNTTGVECSVCHITSPLLCQTSEKRSVPDRLTDMYEKLFNDVLGLLTLPYGAYKDNLRAHILCTVSTFVFVRMLIWEH